MVPAKGVGPLTFRLQGDCSASELSRRAWIFPPEGQGRKGYGKLEGFETAQIKISTRKNTR